MSDLEGAVRTALKNHSTASGHEATTALVSRIMSELHGSGGPISPGKKVAQELASENKANGSSKDGEYAAGEKSPQAPKDKPAAIEETSERSKPAEAVRVGPVLGDEEAKDYAPSFQESADKQHTGRPVAPAPKPAPSDKTSTKIASNRPGTGGNSRTFETPQNYPDGSPRANPEELFAKAGKSARNLIKQTRMK